MIIVKKRPYSWSLTGNPIEYRLYSAAALADPSNFFEIRLRYRNDTTSFFIELPPIPFSPTDGLLKLDICSLLESILKPDLPGYNADEKTIWPTTKQSCEYYIQYREITVADTDPDWDDSETDYRKFALLGGLNYYKWTGDSFWTEYFATNQPFLTWQERGRKAAYDERMFLAWLNTNEDAGEPGTQFVALIKVNFTDGSILTDDKGFTCKKGVVNYIPAGASQWDAQALGADKKIWFWTIEVQKYNGVDGYDPCSELFKYEADNINDYNKKTLHYRNSFYGIDSVRVLGVIERNLSYQLTEIERIFGPEYILDNALTARKSYADAIEILTWKGDIGHLGKEEQDRLRDMHLNRELWWWINKKWWPALNISNNIKAGGSKDNRWTMPFEWTMADSGDPFYTPEAAELGEYALAHNVCLADLTLGDIDIDTSGATAIVEINYNFTLPDGFGMTQAIIFIDSYLAETIFNTAGNNPYVLTDVPKEEIYSGYIQSLCTNGVRGKKVFFNFSTVGAGSGGAGGGGIAINLRLDNDAHPSICTIAYTSVYIAVTPPFAEGDIIYDDAGLTIPHTGHNKVLNTNGNVHSLDNVTGVIGPVTGDTC